MSHKDTLKRVVKYIKKYWFYLLCSLLLAFLTVCGTLYLPILTGRAVDQMIEQGMVDFEMLFSLLRSMGAVILITAVSQWLMSLCNNRMTYLVVRDIRKEAFDKIQILQSLPLQPFLLQLIFQLLNCFLHFAVLNVCSSDICSMFLLFDSQKIPIGN